VSARLEALRATVDAEPHPLGPAARMSDPTHVRHLITACVVGAGGSAEAASSAPGSDPEHRFLDRAVELVRLHGVRGLDIRAIRIHVGMSAASFYRAFGRSDELLLTVRTRIEMDRAAATISRFASILDERATPASLRDALTSWGTELSTRAQASSLRQRAETLAATATDPELHDLLARLQRACRDMLIEQIALAQARGLITSAYSASSIASYVDGIVFWQLFRALDLHAADHATWLGTLQRIIPAFLPGENGAPGAVVTHATS